MIRRILGTALYAMTFSVAAFGLVLAADRRLGVPTPFSILLAPLILPIVAALLLLVRDSRLARAIVVPFTRPARRRQSAASAPTPALRLRSARVAEGFVLLRTAGAADQREVA